MSALTPNALFLLRLARVKSAESRRRLAAVADDLISGTGDAVCARERALILSLFRKLLDDAAGLVRRALAERLSADGAVGDEVIDAVNAGAGSAAREFLLPSEALLDLELLEVLMLRCREHQLATAMRRGLGEPLPVDLPVDDGDFIKSLLESRDSRIAEATLDYVAHQTQSIDTFQEPVVRCTDLSGRLARRVCYWVAAALRQDILDHHNVQIDRLDETIEAVARQAAGGADGEAFREISGAPAVLARRLAEAGLLVPHLLVQCLRQGEIALFEALLAQGSRLRLGLIQRLLFEPGGEGLAIVCRAMGIDKHTFTAIFMLSRRARPSDRASEPRLLTQAAALFDRIEPDAAQAVLATWRRDPEFLYAIKQIQTERTPTALPVPAARPA